ncbi:hypothetical protein HIM_10121 [Hirsutella minnesotensis 3608]|uniref:Uncharacterized protein n=1 Tax=Hirsutella minnesotensis 3608 TaxID=1043627 RepID=A0A0F7ZXC7_9HYPO|nr:hypothetical protein HIM_10121 [Hirsutella minnesotensis 3608]
MSCYRYSVSNGCGHINACMFRFCNGHENTIEEMNRCFDTNHTTMTNGTKVRMGNDFCNRGCEAMTVGWRCCTCGYKSVTGYYHPTAKMLVHDDPYGNAHGFCTRCLTENQSEEKQGR